MAFWSTWFKPKCEACGQKIADAPIAFEEQRICGGCHERILDEREKAEQERIARRRAEEEALRKLEERQLFGPRE